MLCCICFENLRCGGYYLKIFRNFYYLIFFFGQLDPDDESFKGDFLKFQDRILELDMKLAAILCQAFDDCHNLESVFKLISIVGTVLERPKIKEEFKFKFNYIKDA